jgi:tRNA pseudouridine55 synthase
VVDLKDKLFIINKHCGPSSFEVVNAFRRVSRIRKVGHTGTLDPLAEGVLLLCTGKATRASEHFMNLDKTYEFDVRLGIETDTLDSEGKVIQEVPCPDLSRDRIEAAAGSFSGEYNLSPPAYSALKQNGKRLYELARAGHKPEVSLRLVHIYELDLLGIELPVVKLRIRCSRGTYVRSLARDFGRRLDLPAHVERLVRTRIGAFSLETAFPGERLFAGDIEGLQGIELTSALDFLPGIVLKDAARDNLLKGVLPTHRDVAETIGTLSGARVVRILDTNGHLIAVGKRDDGPRKRLAWVDSYRLFTNGGSCGG